MCQISVVGKLFPIVLLVLNSELVLGKYDLLKLFIFFFLLCFAHNF